MTPIGRDDEELVAEPSAQRRKNVIEGVYPRPRARLHRSHVSSQLSQRSLDRTYAVS